MSRRAAVAAWLIACVPFAVVATPPGGDRARIADAASGVQGRTAVNQAAGVGNVQANLAAIALAPHAPVALNLRQHTDAAVPGRDASVSIDAGAFAGSRGLLSVNQAAGSGNAQANLFAIGDVRRIAGHIAGVSDAVLAAVAGNPGTEGAAAPPVLREATLGGDSFVGSQGVVQVNQTAGVGNASVNAIVLQLPRGTP